MTNISIINLNEKDRRAFYDSVSKERDSLLKVLNNPTATIKINHTFDWNALKKRSQKGPLKMHIHNKRKKLKNIK